MSVAETQEQPGWAYYTPAEQIDVRGLDVAYRRRGTGEPVLFLHGLRVAKRWLPLYEELSQSVDLLVPEHPGFGDTPVPEWLDDFTDLVIHYADLLDAFGLDKVHVIGHSFGGWIAAELAAFYPERLRSLTLITPMGLRVAGHTPADVYRVELAEYSEFMFNADEAAYADYLTYGSAPQDVIDAYAELTAMGRVAWNPRYDRKLDRRLGRVHSPTLVVAADEDRFVPRAHAERYAELIPGAKLVSVTGEERPTGHGVVVQEPARLAQQITSFLEA